jgi:hypothetical protein
MDMRTELELGATPCDEDCAQVGADDYSTRATAECRAYINQLYRVLAEKGYTPDKIPQGFRLRVKANRHDLGTYHEVVASFEDDEESWGIALFLDQNSPASWDDAAKAELNLV